MADEEGRIVAGVGVIATGRDGREKNKLKEEAMGQAVMDCLAAGVTDPETQRRFMLHYKDVVKHGGTVAQAREALVAHLQTLG